MKKATKKKPPLTKAAGKPKKRRSRAPKKPPPDPIPTRTALADAVLNTSDDVLAENCHVQDIGKPIGAVLLKRISAAGVSRPATA